MKTQELIISGMNCGHCVAAIKKELGKMSGVEIQDVQIGKAIVQFDENTLSISDFAEVIDATGFELVRN